MTYAFVQDVPIREDMYRAIMKKMGTEPIDGQLLHLVFRRPDGLRYVDVWESRAKCDRAFEDRIHPAVIATFIEAGFRPEGEPKREELELIEISGSRTAPPA